MIGKSRSPYLVIQVAYNFSFSSHETQVTTLFTITDLIPYTLLCMPLYMMLIYESLHLGITSPRSTTHVTNIVLGYNSC
jgi:hypothetical protein